jgi:hypothetical protein
MEVITNVIARGALIKAVNMAASFLPGIILFARLETVDYMALLAIIGISVVLIEAVCVGGSTEAVSSSDKNSIYEIIAGRLYVSIALVPVSLYFLWSSLSVNFLVLASLIPLMTVFSPLLLAQKDKYLLLTVLELFFTLSFLIVKVMFLESIESYITILFCEYFVKASAIVILNYKLRIFNFVGLKLKSVKFGMGLIFLAIISRLEVFYFKDIVDVELSIYLFLSIPAFTILYNYKLMFSRTNWDPKGVMLNDTTLFVGFLVLISIAVAVSMVFKGVFTLLDFVKLCLVLWVFMAKTFFLVNLLVSFGPGQFLRFTSLILLPLMAIFTLLSRLDLTPMHIILLVNLSYIVGGYLWKKKILS